MVSKGEGRQDLRLLLAGCADYLTYLHLTRMSLSGHGDPPLTERMGTLSKDDALLGRPRLRVLGDLA